MRYLSKITCKDKKIDWYLVRNESAGLHWSSYRDICRSNAMGFPRTSVVVFDDADEALNRANDKAKEWQHDTIHKITPEVEETEL